MLSCCAQKRQTRLYCKQAPLHIHTRQLTTLSPGCSHVKGLDASTGTFSGTQPQLCLHPQPLVRLATSQMHTRQLAHSLASPSQPVLPAPASRSCRVSYRTQIRGDVLQHALPERAAAKITPFDLAVRKIANPCGGHIAFAVLHSPLSNSNVLSPIGHFWVLWRRPEQ